MKSFLLSTTIILGLLTTCYGQEPEKISKNNKISSSGMEKLMAIQVEAMKETNKNLSSLKDSEKKVDSTFNAVLKEYAKDSLFISRLTEAQDLWKKHRNADIKAIYPDESPNYYGQVNTDCVCHMLIANNAERLKFLNQWLVGIREGDVCAGSIKYIR